MHKRPLIASVIAGCLFSLSSISTASATDNSIAANDDMFTVSESSGATILSVLSNDASEPSMTITSVSSPNHGGRAVISNAGGSITYTPANYFNGVEVFSYTVSNGVNSSNAQVRITVMPVNDPPVAFADDFNVRPNQESTFLVLNNDTDVDDDVLVITSVSSPTSGTAQITQSRTEILYSSTGTTCGLQTFTYTVSDQNGGTDVGTVSVHVNCANAIDDDYTINEDQTTGFFVLANDEESSTASLTRLTQPTEGGTVTMSQDATYLLFVPTPNYFGTVTFRYTSSNAGSDHAANVTVHVLNVPDVPIANSDTYRTRRNVSIPIQVLANDIDVDSSGISAQHWTNISSRSRIQTTGASTMYVPAKNFCGTDNFTYDISNVAGTSTGNVRVVVSCDKTAQKYALPSKLVALKTYVLGTTTKQKQKIQITAAGTCRVTRIFSRQTAYIGHKKVARKVIAGWKLKVAKSGRCKVSVKSPGTSLYSALKVTRTYIVK